MLRRTQNPTPVYFTTLLVPDGYKFSCLRQQTLASLQILAVQSVTVVTLRRPRELDVRKARVAWACRCLLIAVTHTPHAATDPLAAVRHVHYIGGVYGVYGTC